MNQIMRGICPPLGHALDEVRNSMFLPLTKKAVMGSIGADAKTSFSLVIIRFSCVCYAPGEDFFRGGGTEFMPP